MGLPSSLSWKLFFVILRDVARSSRAKDRPKDRLNEHPPVSISGRGEKGRKKGRASISRQSYL